MSATETMADRSEARARPRPPGHGLWPWAQMLFTPRVGGMSPHAGRGVGATGSARGAPQPAGDRRPRPTLSVVVLTKDEERHIARCLESVRWADELLVIDGMSTDRTVEICRQFGARVIRHPFEGSFAKERNIGLEHATGEWVLQIDADDVVTPAFRDAVMRRLAERPACAAFKFRRKSYLLGRFMRHGGWHHYLPNLVRRDAVRYEGLVHERPVVLGTLGQLDADIDHHPCDDLARFISRHNRYTTLSARELFDTVGRLDERQIRRQLVKKPWKTFWKSYVKKRGALEGMHGLVFALFFAGVELMKWAKYWELCRSPEPMPWSLALSHPDRPARQPLEISGRRRATLAVVMMTKNEARRLGSCLERVAGWADELVIIDDESTDQTIEIARRYTDKVFVLRSDDNHDRQWNRGSERASADWILHIDADEVVTPALRAAIDRILLDDQGCRAFELMRKNAFLGHPMRHGGWYHRHLVLFRRDNARCVGQGIHVQLRVEGRIGRLDAELDHYPFETLAQFIDRQNHYTTVEAEVMRRTRARMPLSAIRSQLQWRPLKLFWKSYVKHKGRREGMYGLVFGLLFTFAHVMLWAKYWELTWVAEQTVRVPVLGSGGRARVAHTSAARLR